MDLNVAYQDRYSNALQKVSERISVHLKDNLSNLPRIDRITARAKAPDSFLKKAIKLTDDGQKRKYSDPLNQIQDQIGVRVVTFYLDDVEVVSKAVLKYYRPIESRLHIPDSASEFGYIGQHFILLLPDDVIDNGIDTSKVPKFFELQIKTLFQHAWSEAEHDLGYKSEEALGAEEKRRIAFTAAQAWGADQIFRDLFQQMNANLN